VRYTYKPGYGFTYTVDVDENLTGVVIIIPGETTRMFVDGNISNSIRLERRQDTVVLVDKFWMTAWLPEEFKQS
jgi:hypothetical protein